MATTRRGDRDGEDELIRSEADLSQEELGTFFEKVPYNPDFKLPASDRFEVNTHNPQPMRIRMKKMGGHFPHVVNYQPKRKINIKKRKAKEEDEEEDEEYARAVEDAERDDDPDYVPEEEDDGGVLDEEYARLPKKQEKSNQQKTEEGPTKTNIEKEEGMSALGNRGSTSAKTPHYCTRIDRYAAKAKVKTCKSK
ncbi:nucleoplasmin-like protein ANO39 [Saccostrea echinata]|uniref:nucleoplasmin-like protein ANO39 n=1 Tax=Saccostrea echinata TaxID=191078 RepID=UPI002A7EC007|nr:nucleoplasmin-like protein ANO39 [Saccostrea echinata]